MTELDFKPLIIHWADDPTRTRVVTAICRICDRQWPIDICEPQVVSATGTAHHAEGDTTLCGHRATSDHWWWAM